MRGGSSKSMITCVPTFQPSWITYAPTLHILASQKIMLTARMSELASTSANLGTYAAQMGISMHCVYQNLNSLSASPSPQKASFRGPLFSDNRPPEQVLGKRKLEADVRSTVPAYLHIGIETVKKRAHKFSLNIGVPLEAVKVSGDFDGKEKANESHYRWRSGSGGGISASRTEFA